MRRYKISKHNSTVCGYPGRDFDWSKFCWNGREVHIDKCYMPGCPHKHETRAPLPYVDTGLIAPNCQYVHVPYDWVEQGTIYRVRPNESMYAGRIYRGKLIKSVKAVIDNEGDGWYWVLD